MEEFFLIDFDSSLPFLRFNKYGLQGNDMGVPSAVRFNLNERDEAFEIFLRKLARGLQGQV